MQLRTPPPPEFPVHVFNCIPVPINVSIPHKLLPFARSALNIVILCLLPPAFPIAFLRPRPLPLAFLHFLQSLPLCSLFLFLSLLVFHIIVQILLIRCLSSRSNLALPPGLAIFCSRSCSFSPNCSRLGARGLSLKYNCCYLSPFHLISILSLSSYPTFASECPLFASAVAISRAGFAQFVTHQQIVSSYFSLIIPFYPPVVNLNQKYNRIPGVMISSTIQMFDALLRH